MNATTNNAADRSGWTSVQTYIVAACSLIAGLCAGYLLPGSISAQPVQSRAAIHAAPTTSSPAPATPQQLTEAVDQQVAPMLRQLKDDPTNPDLLVAVGNTYYDAHRYHEAVTHYDRALKIRPGDTSVRTDLGTAYWYLGDPDRAISEFNTVLAKEPAKANALFNLGVVEWEGKMDSKAALAAWQKLIATNPGYENRAQVERMIAQVNRHVGIKPGAKTNEPAY